MPLSGDLAETAASSIEAERIKQLVSSRRLINRGTLGIETGFIWITTPPGRALKTSRPSRFDQAAGIHQNLINAGIPLYFNNQGTIEVGNFERWNALAPAVQQLRHRSSSWGQVILGAIPAQSGALSVTNRAAYVFSREITHSQQAVPQWQ